MCVWTMQIRSTGGKDKLCPFKTRAGSDGKSQSQDGNGEAPNYNLKRDKGTLPKDTPCSESPARPERQ